MKLTTDVGGADRGPGGRIVSLASLHEGECHAEVDI